MKTSPPKSTIGVVRSEAEKEATGKSTPLERDPVEPSSLPQTPMTTDVWSSCLSEELRHDGPVNLFPSLFRCTFFHPSLVFQVPPYTLMSRELSDKPPRLSPHVDEYMGGSFSLGGDSLIQQEKLPRVSKSSFPCGPISLSSFCLENSKSFRRNLSPRTRWSTRIPRSVNVSLARQRLGF